MVFIATELMKSPFPYCDFVTTTTHKTLRGPRAGMIFSENNLKNKLMIQYFQEHKEDRIKIRLLL